MPEEIVNGHAVMVGQKNHSCDVRLTLAIFYVCIGAASNSQHIGNFLLGETFCAAKILNLRHNNTPLHCNASN